MNRPVPENRDLFAIADLAREFGISTRAIRFYEKAGFGKVGTKSFRLGSTVEHDFVMERALP